MRGDQELVRLKEMLSGEIQIEKKGTRTRFVKREVGDRHENVKSNLDHLN